MRPFLLLLLAAVPAAADQLVLEGGGKLSGEIEHECERSVTLRTPAGSITVPREKIRRVVREEESAYLGREAKARQDSGSTEVAVRLRERALDGKPASREALAQALVAHAEASLDRGRLDAAEAAADRLAEVAPADAALPGIRRRLDEERDKARALKEKAERAARDGDHGTALRALHAWSRRCPDGDPAVARALAAAYADAGDAALSRGRLRDALDRYRSAQAHGALREVAAALDRLEPVAVVELLGSGRDDEAGRRIEALARRYPSPGVARFLAAVRHQIRGELGDAVAAYAEAERLAARGGARDGALSYATVKEHARLALRSAITRPPPAGAERWTETFVAPLQHATSGCVTAHAATAELAAQVARAADASLSSCGERLGLDIPRSLRAEVVVHPRRDLYLAADRNPGDAPLGTLELSRDNTRGVTYPTQDARGRDLLRVETFAGQNELLDAIVPHEMAHVAQHCGFPAFRRAHWLDEGLAMLQESDAVRAHRAAFWIRGGEAIPLAELFALRSTPPGREFLFYNQTCALTEFLKDRGTDRQWRRFLACIAGTDTPGALREAYGIETVSDLERDFLAAAGLSR